MRDSTITDLKDREILNAVQERGECGWLPWRGSYSRAQRLVNRGLLRKAGVASMPPHVLYMLSDMGLEELQVVANQQVAQCQSDTISTGS